MPNMKAPARLATAVFASLMFASCPGAGIGPDGGDVPATEPWGVTGSAGGSVSIGTNSLPSHFRSWDTDDSVVTTVLNAPIIRRNPQTLEFEPGLAETYSISGGATTITVTLRAGLTWSDGEVLDANDVIFSATQLYQDSNVDASDSLEVDGQPTSWQLIDSRTYRVTTPVPYAALEDLASIPVAPEHIVSPVLSVGASEVNSMWPESLGPTEFVGSGPFRIKSAAAAGELELERNPNYYETDIEGTALPYLDSITIVEGNPAELVANGTVDLGPLDRYFVDSVPGGVSTYTIGPSESSTFLAINQNPIEGGGDLGIPEPVVTWLQTEDFRVALAHIINRDRIITEIFDDHGEPLYSPIHPSSPFYWTGSASAAPAYDPAAANALLDALGWTDGDLDGIREDSSGNPIELTLATNAGNTEREDMIAIIAEEADAIGVSITTSAIDFDSLVDQLVSTYDWELILVGLFQSLDPVPSADNFFPSSGNLHVSEPNQSSPRWPWEQTIDDAWEAAATTTDIAARKAEYETIQQTWIGAAPIIYTATRTDYLGAPATLGNVDTAYLHPFPGFGWEALIARIYVK